MQQLPIYRYTRNDGGITYSLKMPPFEYSERIRLIADEGKLLTNGDIVTPVKDVDSIEGWYEIDKPEEQKPASTFRYSRK